MREGLLPAFQWIRIVSADDEIHVSGHVHHGYALHAIDVGLVTQIGYYDYTSYLAYVNEDEQCCACYCQFHLDGYVLTLFCKAFSMVEAYLYEVVRRCYYCICYLLSVHSHDYLHDYVYDYYHSHAHVSNFYPFHIHSDVHVHYNNCDVHGYYNNCDVHVPYDAHDYFNLDCDEHSS